jgi:hypothetical protein
VKEVAKVPVSKRKELNKFLNTIIKLTGCYVLSGFLFNITLHIKSDLRPQYFLMKKLIILFVAAIIFLTSCSRGITPFEAANGKAKCGRYLK